VEYFGSTMSGQPGRLRTCRRNLKPIAWSARRTVISGRVSLDRTLAMSADRCSGVILSAMAIAASFPAPPVSIGGDWDDDDSIGQRSHPAQSRGHWV